MHLNGYRYISMVTDTFFMVFTDTFFMVFCILEPIKHCSITKCCALHLEVSLDKKFALDKIQYLT